MEPIGFTQAGIDLRSKYKVCRTVEIEAKCGQLIRILPNNPRADSILKSIDDTANNAEAMDPIADTDEVVTGLLLCAFYAVSAVYNAPAQPKTTISAATHGLFTALTNYAVSNLNCSPVPPLLQEAPTTHRAARKGARERDSRSVHVHSGPRCVFTGMIRAQAAHIIPVDTAGGVSRGRWFWLWLMIVLPSEELNRVWEMCGGRRNNSLDNVIMLCQPIHELYDAMSIMFRPIDTDTPAEGYSLIIESSQGPIPLHGLYDHNGNSLRLGSRIDWQRQATATNHPPPAPFLFAVHRYFCKIRADLPLRNPPSPAPEITESSSFTQAWDEIAATPRASAAGTPRTSATASRASSAASSRTGASYSPGPSAAALRAALEQARNPRAAGYDGAEDYYEASDSDEERELMEVYGRRMTKQEMYELHNPGMPWRDPRNSSESGTKILKEAEGTGETN